MTGEEALRRAKASRRILECLIEAADLAEGLFPAVFKLAMWGVDAMGPYIESEREAIKVAIAKERKI